MKKLIILTLVSAFFTIVVQSGTAYADTRYIKTVEAEFEDIIADMEDAVINLGLVVDHSGDIGGMLERTAEASGSPSPYVNARYMQFCSAALTSKATQADLRNISICPFLIFAFESTNSPGKVSVGYRKPDFGSLVESDGLYIEVHALLKNIIDEVTEGY